MIEVGIMPLHHLGRSRYESLGRPYPIGNLTLIPDEQLQKTKNLIESYGLRCRIEA